MGKIFKFLISLILTKESSEIFCEKMNRCKIVLMKTKTLQVFWFILFFPFNLILDIVIALLKVIFIIIFSKSSYGKIIFSIKEIYKDIVERKLTISVTVKRVKLRNKLFIKGKEKKVSYGNLNPDKIFYVIKPYYYVEPNELLTHPQHLLYYYYLVLQKISFALSKGYYPIVDFKNYEGLLYFAEPNGVHGEKNAWEYFWKQPSDYKLEEVYQSKNVIIATRNSEDYGFIPPTVMTKPFNKYAKDLAIKCSKYADYTQLNEATAQYIQTWQKKLFPDNKKILGVVYRSTSYGSEHTLSGNHPIQPSLSVLAKRVKELIIKWNIDYIYFVNEEDKNINYMRKVFGKQLIVLPRKRYIDFHEFSKEDPNPLYVHGERYNTNLSYLTEIVLLSRCNSLIGAMSSGTRAAIIWNQCNYENIEIIDLGMW